MPRFFHLDGLLAAHPEVRTAPDLLDYEDNVYGSWFQVAATGIDILFGVQDFYEAFLLRHYLTFLIYVVGCVFLLRTLDLLFDNGWISLACLSLFITQPRFFAEAFYNPKDIPCLSAVLIATYYVVAYLTAGHGRPDEDGARHRPGYGHASAGDPHRERSRRHPAPRSRDPW